MDVTHTGSSMKWRTALLVLWDKHVINQGGNMTFIFFYGYYRAQSPSCIVAKCAAYIPVH